MWKVHLFLEISKILESRLMVNLLGKAGFSVSVLAIGKSLQSVVCTARTWCHLFQGEQSEQSFLKVGANDDADKAQASLTVLVLCQLHNCDLPQGITRLCTPFTHKIRMSPWNTAGLFLCP